MNQLKHYLLQFVETLQRLKHRQLSLRFPIEAINKKNYISFIL